MSNEYHLIHCSRHWWWLGEREYLALLVATWTLTSDVGINDEGPINNGLGTVCPSFWCVCVCVCGCVRLLKQ